MRAPPYRWPDGKRSAVCFTADVDAEAPYLWTSRAGLPQHLGLLEQRRFGPREGLWRILDMLDRLSIKGTFFTPSVVAELHPEILPALVERGHEVGLHGHLHEIVSETTRAEFEDALDRSLAIVEAQTKARPAGFRSPAWEMTPGMIGALKDRGIAYDSSLSGYDHPYEIDGLVEIPVQWQIDDAIFFRFFGGGVDKWPPARAADVGDAWIDEFEAGRAYGQLLMITIHPWISGRAQRVAMLERVLGRVAAQDDVWIATAGEIARWHETSDNAGVYAVESGLEPLAEAIARSPITTSSASGRTAR
ncbi:polysaccharide deacetylase family protein [Salinarimonas ramus]|uniref:Chitooligosaccharide deacetylase n=1 Tax=Salinarimonas ramus TaxID=690164 RepID=A0A917V715_9HYPH|nr:polysaccharide deacetylase [Salinarimonas ramus]GGK45024.1 polysaccharide deacetylase [Salinarimonas ramus]